MYILALAALVAFAQASIDNKPVKVTHQNSGPSYDIDEVEKTKLTPEREEGQIARRLPFSPMPRPINNEEQPQGDNDGSTVGHINIRRIFLIPMSQPSQDDDSASSSNIWSSSQSPRQSQSKEEDPQDRPPVWPFLSLMPSRHLFGSDEASRGPQRGEESFPRPTTSERERENTPETRQRPPFDPIQMMVEMMQQALSQAMLTPNGPFQDLNKETGAAPAAAKPNDSDNKAESSETNTNTGNNNDANEMPKRPFTELESPFKPIPINNSTKEEIVEIDGKKYLKKTILNRHVGENIIFMTKRLLFVPLNETSPTTVDNENKAEDASTPLIPSSTPTEESRKAEPETTPTITIPSSTTPTEASSTPTASTTPEATTTTTTTMASTTPSEPSSTTPTSSTTTEVPSTTPSTVEREATEESLKDKMAETLKKASESILDKLTSSSN